MTLAHFYFIVKNYNAWPEKGISFKKVLIITRINECIRFIEKDISNKQIINSYKTSN